MGLSGLKTPLNEFSSFFQDANIHKNSDSDCTQIVHYSICYLIDNGSATELY